MQVRSPIHGRSLELFAILIPSFPVPYIMYADGVRGVYGTSGVAAVLIRRWVCILAN